MTDRGDVEGAWPLAYLLTWRTYGTWLPGDARGSITQNCNRWNTATHPPDPLREAEAFQSLRHPPILLDLEQRASVENTVEETAKYRGWTLTTVNARSNHVHVILSAQRQPEGVMNSLKSWCTRRMRESRLIGIDLRPWAEGGSTRYLWTQSDVERAVAYVLEAQDGERFETED